MCHPREGGDDIISNGDDKDTGYKVDFLYGKTIPHPHN